MSETSEAERPYFTPSSRVAGDWSAHIATTLDRLAGALEQLTPQQWEAPSLCEGWRVRDVAGHLVWRLGTSNGDMLKTATSGMLRRGGPSRAFGEIAQETAEASTGELVTELRRIADAKVYKHGRTGIGELTEAVVHTIDITEALGITLRLSPRSTSAVAVARLRLPFTRASRLVRGHSLVATDARWRIGTGTPITGTAAELIAALFDRRPFPPAQR